MLGTTLSEASPQINSISPIPIPTNYFQPIMTTFVGASRAATIAATPAFQLDPSDSDTTRKALSNVGTLFFWACANQFNALTYAPQANVYLYQLEVGATHPNNANDAMCTTGGAVCHEDDIPLLFGTHSSPTAQQTATGAELRGRWIAFASSGNPNVAGKIQWNTVGSATNLNALRISANSVVNQTLYSNLCGPVFGSTVLYNFQMD
jgi:carboxylesterase type B